MNTVKMLKKQAKDALNGKWTTADAGLFAVFAVILLVFLFFAMLGSLIGAFTDDEQVDITVVVKLLSVFCLTFLLAIALLPIKNGFFRLCYNISRGQEADFADVFYFFKGTKQYLKALQFNIFTAAKLLAAYFVTFSGYNILRIPMYETNYGNVPVYMIARSALFACGVALFILFSFRIIISEFVFVDDENAPLSYVSRATRVIAKNHNLDIILLNYSFIPWIALCFLVIPALYVIPYISTATATSTKWLLKLYKEGKMV